MFAVHNYLQEHILIIFTSLSHSILRVAAVLCFTFTSLLGLKQQNLSDAHFDYNKDI